MGQRRKKKRMLTKKEAIKAIAAGLGGGKSQSMSEQMNKRQEKRAKPSRITSIDEGFRQTVLGVTGARRRKRKKK